MFKSPPKKVRRTKKKTRRMRFLLSLSLWPLQVWTMLILGGLNEVLTAGITKQCCRVYSKKPLKGHGRSADAKAKPKPQVKPKPKVVNRYHDLNYLQSHSTVEIESLSDEAPEDQIWPDSTSSSLKGTTISCLWGSPSREWGVAELDPISWPWCHIYGPPCPHGHFCARRHARIARCDRADPMAVVQSWRLFSLLEAIEFA